MSFELEYNNRKAFIEAQLRLYKTQFIETNDDKYLEVMNELSKTSVFLTKCRDTMYKVHRENKNLKEEIKLLKQTI